jgi:hypothetical protein
MRFKRTFIAGLAAFGLAAAGSAGAQEGYGALHYFGWTVDHDQLSEIESAGVRASGGYTFADYGLFDLGVEVHAATGGSDELEFPVGATATEEATAELNKVVAAFVKPRLPLLGGLVNVYGLAGYSYGKLDILAETTARSVTEHGFSWGGGAEVALIPDRLYLAADYVSYISGDDFDATAASVGLRLLFSQ